MKKNLFAFLMSGAWISLSEFIRNELLFKSFWLEKYASLGLQFPSSPLNNALWGVWSFALAGATLFCVTRLPFFGSLLVLWTMAFLMMWIAIGNLNVLPFKLLLYAVPLSALEIGVAAAICRKLAR